MQRLKIIILHAGKLYDSVSLNETDRFIAKLKETINIECDIETVKLREMNLQFCKGCINCFMNGRCVIRSDDVEVIKELLLKSDLIIVSAPVYVNHISGELKVFIDRIGYWTHLFRLAGKLCVNVITSSNSGIKEVKGYLEQTEAFMGLTVLGTLEYRMLNEYRNTEAGDKILADIVNYYEKSIHPHVDQEQLEYFLNYQKAVQNRKCSEAEYEYWQRTGLIYRQSLL